MTERIWRGIVICVTWSRHNAALQGFCKSLGYYPAGGGTDQLRFTRLPAASFLNSINFTGFDPGVRTLPFGSYFEVVPMPEPASLSLLALGGLALLRRRRK